MNEDAVKGIRRAHRALASARVLISEDPESAASRAYYAAFHAVSLLFRLEGHDFSRHSAVQTAVHRDLVRAGRWVASLGRDYTFLLETRMTGDYDDDITLCEEDALKAVAAAERIIAAVERLLVDVLPPSTGGGA